MAKRRVNGEGSIRNRSDDCWEGRYTAGRHLETEKAIYKNVLAKPKRGARESSSGPLRGQFADKVGVPRFELGASWTPRSYCKLKKNFWAH